MSRFVTSDHHQWPYWNNPRAATYTSPAVNQGLVALSCPPRELGFQLDVRLEMVVD